MTRPRITSRIIFQFCVRQLFSKYSFIKHRFFNIYTKINVSGGIETDCLRIIFPHGWRLYSHKLHQTTDRHRNVMVWQLTNHQRPIHHGQLAKNTHTQTNNTRKQHTQTTHTDTRARNLLLAGSVSPLWRLCAQAFKYIYIYYFFTNQWWWTWN